MLIYADRALIAIGRAPPLVMIAAVSVVAAVATWAGSLS